MNIGWAVVIGAVLIAASIAISHRYEMVPISMGDGFVTVWRTDNLTGQITYCDRTQTSAEGCAPVKIYPKPLP